MNKNEVVSKILKFIPYERIFLFQGQLGAGKTTLIKLIAKKLNIKEKILSPTFILWQKYEIKIKNKKFFLNHIDLYRVETKDILKIGLKKEIKNPKNIFFIEWGEKLEKYLKRNKINYVKIVIQKKGKKREIEIIKSKHQ